MSALKNILITKPKTVAEEIAAAGTIAYCKLYNEHPFWTFARIGKNFGPISRAVAEACIHTPYPPPQPPLPSFIGGQCNVDYRVIFSCKAEFWQHTNLGGNVFLGYVFPCVNSEEFTIISGPILSINSFFSGPCSSNDPNQIECTWGRRDLSIKIICANIPLGIDLLCSVWSEGPFQGTVITPSNRNYLKFNSITEKQILIQRIDNLPDDCGNPPASFPEIPPPPPGSRSEAITINNYYGDDITYNTDINQDDDGGFGFPPVIFVDGITLELDVGGISFNINNNHKKPSKKPSLDLPNYNEPISTPEPPIEEPIDLESDSYKILPTSIIGSDPKIVGIIITFNSIPANAKMSDGNESPRIIYGGWIEFGIGNNFFPRNYLDFDNNYIPAPSGAKNWAITIKRGYNAKIFKLIKVVNNGS